MKSSDCFTFLEGQIFIKNCFFEHSYSQTWNLGISTWKVGNCPTVTITEWLSIYNCMHACMCTCMFVHARVYVHCHSWGSTDMATWTTNLPNHGTSHPDPYLITLDLLSEHHWYDKIYLFFMLFFACTDYFMDQ